MSSNGATNAMLPRIVPLAVMFLLVCSFSGCCLGSQSAQDLYMKLMSDYNPLIRPVVNNTDVLTVYIGLALSQLVDIDERNQIMITSIWLKQTWKDYRLAWDPDKHEQIKTMKIPIDMLWIPDIVLYNNAEGAYTIEVVNRANVRYDGTVFWNPPGSFRSSCLIDISFFPFDEQECKMKFGTWTYDGDTVDLQPLYGRVEREHYRPNGEWEIMEAPVERHAVKYPCCVETYLDVTYYFVLHRNPLFYVITLVIPCILITLMAVLVFYLPSDAQEKITLCISVLLALIVFLLLIPDLIPPTSKTIPLIGQYMLFTMAMCSISIVATVLTINWHFRTINTHDMSPWMRTVFLEKLPWLLGMERPEVVKAKKEAKTKKKMEKKMRNHMSPYTSHASGYPHKTSQLSLSSNKRNSALYRQFEDSHGGAIPSSLMEEIEGRDSEMNESLLAYDAKRKRPIRKEWRDLLHSLKYIQKNMQFEDDLDQSEEDWRYVGLVIDRLLFWIFAVVAVAGTVAIFIPAPVFWERPDHHEPLVYEDPILLEALTYNQFYNITS